ncbi:MAG: CoA-binding protein [Promethearchaeota archaeon]
MSERINVKDISFIDNIKSMAVIGPSQKRKFFFVKSHQENFKGDLYVVHPTITEIKDFDSSKIYKSVKDIPGDVDFVFIAVPQSQILEVMGECAEKGVKLASVFTAEFSDAGTEEGRELERELIKRTQKKVRILGPNGMGLYCPKLGIAWRPRFPAKKGNIAFISQSGGICNIAIYTAIPLGLSFSKVFSFGNGNDLDFIDILYYLINDPDTEIIMCYLEGIKEGRGKTLKQVLAQNKKPLIIVKGGKSKSGSFAARTHTAALTGDHKIWGSVFKQYKVIETDSIEQMLYTAKLIDNYGDFDIQHIAVFSISGGYGVIMVDLLEKYGMKVPPFSLKIQKQLDEKFFTRGTSSKNPLDVSAQVFDAESMYEIMDLALSDKKIDALVLDLPSWYFNQEFHLRKNPEFETKIIDALCLGKKHNKPLIPIIQRAICLEDRTRAYKSLSERKVPVFGDPMEFIPLLQKISIFSRKQKQNWKL